MTTADQDQEDRALSHPIVTFQGLHERVTTLEERLDHMIARLNIAEQWMKSADDRLSGIPASIDEILQMLNRET
jgi:hypothetical protein